MPDPGLKLKRAARSAGDHAAGCMPRPISRAPTAGRPAASRRRLEHVPTAVSVRSDAEPADGRPRNRNRAQFQPRDLRHWLGTMAAVGFSFARLNVMGRALYPLWR